MAIAVQCAQCSASFRVKDELAGRRGRCPRCTGLIEVPTSPSPVASQASAAASQVAVAVAPAHLDADATPEGGDSHPPAHSTPPTVPDTHNPWRAAESPARQRQIIEGLSTPIKPVPTSLAYRVTLLLVSVVMVLLPVVYVALIAAAAFVVYWHATNHLGILMVGGYGWRAGIVKLFLYASPIAVGGILVLFMIKPLFARPVYIERRRSLTRQGEPLLYEFVDRLCEVVGAKPPTRIDVDLQVNAAAVLRGKERILVIGLPLVAGLSLRQFAGVLAHEFGHFRQGAGVRASYQIRRINAWFERVAYERDQWDEWLEELSDHEEWWIQLVAMTAKGGVWTSRLILKGLMLVGAAVGGALSRQMEFDADLRQIRLGGSETFETAFRRVYLIDVATDAALGGLNAFFRDGKLADNLPALILYTLPKTPRHLMKKLDEAIDKSRTHVLASHPSTRSRIERAKRENTQGVFQVEGTAGELFRDFRTLSRNCTWDLYRGVFGPRVKISDLHPVDELLGGSSREESGPENQPTSQEDDSPIPLAE